MKPMEFSIFHIIQRQMPNYWQEKFEGKLVLEPEDFYVCHGFIVKTNRFFMNQKRFFILTNDFLFNVEAEFSDKECKTVEVKSTKWKVPIMALKAIEIMHTEYFKISAYFDLERIQQFV